MTSPPRRAHRPAGQARCLAAIPLLLACLGLSSELGAQARDPGKPASDPKVIYGALNPLLEYQRRFFERRMIDPAFLARFNELVRAGDFPGAAAFVAQSIGVSGAIVVVGPAPGAPAGTPASPPKARICFSAGAITTCSEWS